MKTYTLSTQAKTQALIQQWNSYSSDQERQWWYRSLPLDQKGLLKNHIVKPTSLF